MTQAILEFLPGYMFANGRLVSTGAALPPTQHINPNTGELMYYVRPLYDFGSSIGLFVRHQGIIDALDTTKGRD